MSYRNRTIKVLSKKEIEERYPKENNSNMAKLTREFVERGFKIVRLKMDGLSNEKFLTMEVNDADRDITIIDYLMMSRLTCQQKQIFHRKSNY